MDENCFIISDDEDEVIPPKSDRRTRRGNKSKQKRQRVGKGVAEEDESESDIISIPSDTDSDDDLPAIWASDNESNTQHDVDSRDIPSTSKGSKVKGSGYGKWHSEIKREVTTVRSKAKVVKAKSSERQIKDSSSDEAQALAQEIEAGDELFKDEDKSRGRRGEPATVDSESEDKAEEQTNSIGEEEIKLDGDSDFEEEQTGHQTEQCEPGNVDGEGEGNVITLGDFLSADTQSYSQVEPAKVKFEHKPWENLQYALPGYSSPDADSGRESPLPRGSPSFATDRDAVSVDTPSTNDMDLHRSGFTLQSISDSNDIESGPKLVCKRPKENYTAVGKKRRRARPDSSDDSSSTDDEHPSPHVRRKQDTLPSEQADATWEMKAKCKTHRERKGQEKKQKIGRGCRGHAVSMAGSQENPKTGQGQSGGRSQREDRSPSLNERMDEEPMDIASDEDVHKLGQCLVGRVKPLVSESETDSDETCIDDDDFKESFSHASSIEPELLSSQAVSAEVKEEVSDSVQNVTVTADGIPMGSTTLTLGLTPRRKKEPKVTEEDTSLDVLGPSSSQAGNIKQDLPSSERGTAHIDERLRGKAPKEASIEVGEEFSETVHNTTVSAGTVSTFYGTSKGTQVPSKSTRRELGSLSSTPARAESWDGVFKNEPEDQEPEDLDDSPSPVPFGLAKEQKVFRNEPEDQEPEDLDDSPSPVPFGLAKEQKVFRNEPEDQEPEDLDDSLSPVPFGLPTEQQMEENERGEIAYPETMPFSPTEDVHVWEENNDSQDFYTQPFSPKLDDDSENLTSDAVNELGISQATVPRESPSHSTDDEGHDRQEGTVKKSTDSQISWQSSDKEDPQDIINDADIATLSRRRSYTESLSTQQQQKPLEDVPPGQYFPTDSQLSISLDSEDTEELTTQHGKAPVPPSEEPQSALSISTKSHSSRGVSEDLEENSGKKMLPCQRNAWSPSELDPQQRFLLLQEGDTEAMSFSQENEDMPPFPAETPSTSAAALENQATNRNKSQQGTKKNTPSQRPSKLDNLLSTIRQTDLQKKKNLTKKTKPVQDTPHSPSNPPGVSLKDPSETPSASSISSLQDCSKQAESAKFNEVAPEDAVSTVPRSMVNSVSLVPSLSSPSPSSYLANISESSITRTDGPNAQLGTSQTSNNIQETVKATGDVEYNVPRCSTNPSSIASNISRPLKKRPVSQATKVPSGKQRTEPSEAPRVNKELKKEDILACILSWDTDWYEKHKEVSSSEVLQSFLTCEKLSKSCKSYSDVRSYQKAFSCFLLMEMWCKVSCSLAKDCPGTWKQNLMVNELSQEIVEVQYESDDNQTEAHGMSDGDLVLIDMTTVNATQKQFQFGLVQGNGPSERSVCLALHKSTIVPSLTRLKVVQVVTSLSHYLNQIRALLSFTTHPLSMHIVKPGDSHVLASERQETQMPNDLFITSTMESLKRSKMIRLINGHSGTGKTTFLHHLVYKWITKKNNDVPKTAKNPHKLLVCAPTSQSLDVLLRKIWETLTKKEKGGARKESPAHIIDGVHIVRVGKAEEADKRLTEFLLSTIIATTKREQGLPYDKLSEDELKTKILQRADIVGCTLEDCGLEIVRSSLAGNVYALIVDDASHCLETEILLALQCETKHVFMAGDQDQGIVNIRSKESQELDYGRSMLERLAENFEMQDKRIHRWETQYRMKEEIAKFPSSYFYLHRLKTLNRPKPFFLRPYTVFDVADGKESYSRESVINNSEVSFIVDLFLSFAKCKVLTFTVGIIAPSTGQKSKLIERCQGKGILIGTPTDFYGLEKDVIILCCTHTSSQTLDNNGFVLNKQLLNLVLTRAKLSLIIVGNMKSMQQMNGHWESLVSDARKRQLVFGTLQGSYITDVKKCHNSDETTPLNPSASSSRPEQLPSMYSTSGARPPSRHPAGQDGPPRRSEVNYRQRHNSGAATPANQSASSSRPEQHPIMYSAARGRPPSVLPAGQDGPPRRSEGNDRQRHNSGEATPANSSASSSRPEQHPSMYSTFGARNPAGQDGPPRRSEENFRCRYDPGPQGNPEHGNGLDPMEADVVMPSGVNSLPADGGSGRRSSMALSDRGNVPMVVGEQHLPDALRVILSRPSSRGSVPSQSIPKKPHQSIAATSQSGLQEEEFAAIDQVHHSLRSQRRPVASTSTAPDRSTSNTSLTTQTHSRSNHSRDSIPDTDNGKTWHAIAKGMRDNQMISNQQKGKIIAGRVVGKRKPLRASRKESIQGHGRRERTPSNRASSSGTSHSNRVSNEKRTERGQGHEQHQQQDQSHPRPQRPCHRPQPFPERHGQRMEALNQLATNPAHLDPNMRHNRDVHERIGGRSTALTEPQPNIRRRRRSNYVKDVQMDFRN